MSGKQVTEGEQKDILEAFHDHPDLELPGDHVEAEIILSDDPRYVQYVHSDPPTSVYDSQEEKGSRGAELNIDRKPGPDYVLKGNVTHDISISFVEDTNSFKNLAWGVPSDNVIGSGHSGINPIAEFSIPVEFSDETLEETVESLVQVLELVHEYRAEMKQRHEEFMEVN